MSVAGCSVNRRAGVTVRSNKTRPIPTVGTVIRMKLRNNKMREKAAQQRLVDFHRVKVYGITFFQSPRFGVEISTGTTLGFEFAGSIGARGKLS